MLLVNDGNTCYFNTALQIALCIKQHDVDCNKIHNPKALLNLLRFKYPKFTKNKQHDAHEAFIAIIELSKVLSSCCSGKQSYTTTCIACKTSNSVSCHFNTLFLPPSGTFSNDLAAFFQLSHIDDFHCDSCKHVSRATLKTSITFLPQYTVFKTTSIGIPFFFEIKDYSFELLSVCCYYGNTMNGHYACFVKYIDQWFFKNDDFSKRVDKPIFDNVCFVVYKTTKLS